MNSDDRLADLLTRAVESVEPHDRLAEIRGRVRSRRLRWRRWAAPAGAVLVAAALVTAVALVISRPAPPTEPAEDQVGTAVAVYYLGDTPAGPRLFREFHRRAVEHPAEVVTEELSTPPEDPDYWTPWPDGFFLRTSFDPEHDDGTIELVVADDSMRERPVGMSRTEASIAVQQVLRTMQAAWGGRWGVTMYLPDGNHVGHLLGVPLATDMTVDRQLDTHAYVNISDPSEGTVVSDDFTARGVAYSFEATVPWELRDGDGAVVRRGSATAAGSTDQLHPWETEVDVSGLPPGRYTFAAMTDDPVGGTEGPGPTTDTRTVVIE